MSDAADDPRATAGALDDLLRSESLWRDALSGPEGDPHPSVETLRKYAVLDLDEVRLATVESHLRRCGQCRAAVAIIDEGPLNKSGQVLPFPRRRRIALLAIGLAAAAALVALVLRPRPDGPQAPPRLAAAAADELVTLAEEIGKVRGLGLNGSQPPPVPNLAAAFRREVLALPGDEARAARVAWTEVEGSSGDHASPELGRWARWLLAVGFTEAPAANALGASTVAAFVRWSAPNVEPFPVCRAHVAELRSPPDPAVVRRIARCLIGGLE